jgi:hypothetical protein
MADNRGSESDIQNLQYEKEHLVASINTSLIKALKDLISLEETFEREMVLLQHTKS